MEKISETISCWLASSSIFAFSFSCSIQWLTACRREAFFSDTSASYIAFKVQLWFASSSIFAFRIGKLVFHSSHKNSCRRCGIMFMIYKRRKWRPKLNFYGTIERTVWFVSSSSRDSEIRKFFFNDVTNYLRTKGADFIALITAITLVPKTIKRQPVLSLSNSNIKQNESIKSVLIITINRSQISREKNTRSCAANWKRSTFFGRTNQKCLSWSWWRCFRITLQ